MRKYKVTVIGLCEPMFYSMLMTYEESVNIIMEQLYLDEARPFDIFKYYISEV